MCWPSSRGYLEAILKPHVALTGTLLGMARSDDTGDVRCGIETAALLVFMAGLDKVLSLACAFLHVAGQVDRKWLKSSPGQSWAGLLTCGNGMTEKIGKLRALGALHTEFALLVEVRNYYIHGHSLLAGYKIGTNEECTEPTLRPYGPSVGYGLAPSVGVTLTGLKQLGEGIIEELVEYIDRKTPWQENMRAIHRRLKSMPHDPPKELAQVATEPDPSRIVECLNAKHVGVQWEKLMAGL